MFHEKTGPTRRTLCCHFGTFWATEKAWGRITAESRMLVWWNNYSNEEERDNRPFQNSPGPLFQNEDRCSAFAMKSFFILMQIKLIFTRKVVHLDSFWKWGSLEPGSGLLRQEEAIKCQSRFIERPSNQCCFQWCFRILYLKIIVLILGSVFLRPIWRGNVNFMRHFFQITEIPQGRALE